MQIDFGERLIVYTVRLFFRRECCYTRNYDLGIRIGDIPATANNVGNPLVAKTSEDLGESKTEQVRRQINVFVLVFLTLLLKTVPL